MVIISTYHCIYPCLPVNFVGCGLVERPGLSADEPMLFVAGGVDIIICCIEIERMININ